MLKARVEVNRLVPLETPTGEYQQLMRECRDNKAFQYLLLRLQRRYLELALRHDPDELGDAQIAAGTVRGARYMLDTIDKVMAELTRTAAEAE